MSKRHGAESHNPGLVYYVLKGRQVTTTDDPREWVRFFNSEARIIDQDEVGDAFVSTVFLGFDHSSARRGPPVLFETMISGLGGEPQWRYQTIEEAEAGHARVVDALRRGESVDEL